MKKDGKRRDAILTVKVTAEEKERIMQYANERCVNVSALIRKLLFDKLNEHTEASGRSQGT